MKAQIFGGIRVELIAQFDHLAIDPGWLLAGVTADDIAEHEHWLGPRRVEPGTWRRRARTHMPSCASTKSR